MTTFAECSLYTCDEHAEHIIDDEPEQAIVSHLDQVDEDEMLKLCRSGVTVYGYVRAKVTDAHIRRAAKFLRQWFEEYFPENEEELCDPDGDHMFPDKAACDQFEQDVAPLIRAACDRSTVWSAECVAKHHFSGEAVREIAIEWGLLELALPSEVTS